MQRLAQGEAKSDAQRRLQVAAAACLPNLLLRVEQQRSHQTLLRASGAADNAEQTLLRTVTDSSAESQPDQLLRPGRDPSTTDRH